MNTNLKKCFKQVYQPVDYYVNDHTIIYDEKKLEYHLFYIIKQKNIKKGNSEAPVIGHAVSSDLINWEQQQPVLEKSSKHEWESGVGGNAPFVIKDKDTYYLFYSRYHPNCLTQQIGLALSNDLYNWTRYQENPVIRPGKWSRWDYAPIEWPYNSCRDPHIIKIEELFHCYYTAFTKTGKSCIAKAVSNDLLNWNDAGIIYEMPLSNIGAGMTESPNVIMINNKWYLSFTHGYGVKFIVSDNMDDWLGKEIAIEFPSLHASEIIKHEKSYLMTSCLIEVGSKVDSAGKYKDNSGLFLAKIDFSDGIKIMPLQL